MFQNNSIRFLLKLKENGNESFTSLVVSEWSLQKVVFTELLNEGTTESFPISNIQYT